MKTTPTETDREAARLFTPDPGMRVFNGDAGWGRLAEAMWAGATLVHWATDSYAVDGARVDAIDTDDPATVGVMLAQVEAAAGPVLLFWDAWKDGMTYYVLRYTNKWSGPTRGAALVAAMRALKVAT